MANTFSPDPARVFAFLRQWPIYQPTPVREFKTADGTLFIKDETARMGLGAFKALGGPFAVSQLLADRWSEVMKSPLPADEELRAFAKDVTFVCASAGNHGMAVAAGARHAGAKARIHLAATVQQVFADRLEAHGATVVRSGDTYEESVAAATRAASAMRTLWCCSYFSLRPRRIEIVSSTVGSPTNTGWKRRWSAGSFSTYF